MGKKLLNLQFQFKDKTFRRNSVFVNALPREESAIKILGSILVLFVCSYIFLVSLSIVNVIARKEAGDESKALRAIVGQLERNYFALSHGLQASDGDVLGLTDVSETDYIHRPGAVAKENVRNEI